MSASASLRRSERCSFVGVQERFLSQFSRVRALNSGTWFSMHGRHGERLKMTTKLPKLLYWVRVHVLVLHAIVFTMTIKLHNDFIQKILHSLDYLRCIVASGIRHPPLEILLMGSHTSGPNITPPPRIWVASTKLTSRKPPRLYTDYTAIHVQE